MISIYHLLIYVPIGVKYVYNWLLKVFMCPFIQIVNHENVYEFEKTKIWLQQNAKLPRVSYYKAYINFCKYTLRYRFMMLISFSIVKE